MMTVQRKTRISRTIATFCALAGAVALLAPAALAKSQTQTRHQAELNILQTPRYFWRAGLHGFLRSKVMTFRSGVVVACLGGHGPKQTAHSFSCTLRYHTKAIRVRYIATSRYGFRLRFIPRAG